MCDYSLQNIASRPAAVGDKLVTSRFHGALSQGFAAVDGPKAESGLATEAVCVLPGTEIGFDAPIKTRPLFSSEEKTHEHAVGIFRQVSLESKFEHHDALELPNGEIVKLHALEIGQVATVLQLPAAPKTAEEAKAQERLEVVA